MELYHLLKDNVYTETWKRVPLKGWGGDTTLQHQHCAWPTALAAHINQDKEHQDMCLWKNSHNMNSPCRRNEIH